jgi:hypothetical protein
VRGVVLTALGNADSLVAIAASSGGVELAFTDFDAPPGRVVFSLSKETYSGAQVKIEASVFRAAVQLATAHVELRSNRFSDNVGLESGASATNIVVEGNVFRVPQFNSSLIIGGAASSVARLTNNVYLQRPGPCVGALISRGDISSTLRNNTFAALQCSSAAVRHISFTAMDMGTSSEPGGNVFIDTRPALAVEFGTVSAIGNSWGDDNACNVIAVDANTSVVVDSGGCPR